MQQDYLIKILIRFEEKWQTISIGNSIESTVKFPELGMEVKISLSCVIRRLIRADLNFKQ